jgi:DNA-binding GntR family transcriptional regulator
MSTQFAVLKNKVLRPEIAKSLREAIFEGKLKPGEQIQEANIAAQLGVSRSPLREALLMLEKDGLVEIKPHRGAFVRNLSEKEVGEILSVRFPLEVMALSLAQARITPGELGRLRFIFDGMRQSVKSGNVALMVEQEFDFHKSIWAASGNDLLSETLVRICTPWFAFSEITFTQAQLGLSGQPESHEIDLEVHHILIDFLAGATNFSALECQLRHFSPMNRPLNEALILFPNFSPEPPKRELKE